jgi:hypothetical protein
VRRLTGIQKIFFRRNNAIFEKEGAAGMPFLLCKNLWLNEGYTLYSLIFYLLAMKKHTTVNREMLWKILTDNGTPTNIIATT